MLVSERMEKSSLWATHGSLNKTRLVIGWFDDFVNKKDLEAIDRNMDVAHPRRPTPAGIAPRRCRPPLICRHNNLVLAQLHRSSVAPQRLNHEIGLANRAALAIRRSITSCKSSGSCTTPINRLHPWVTAWPG
jgi:hypothetical protein